MRYRFLALRRILAEVLCCDNTPVTAVTFVHQSQQYTLALNYAEDHV